MVLGTLRALTLLVKEATEESGTMVAIELLRDVDKQLADRITGESRICGTRKRSTHESTTR